MNHTNRSPTDSVESRSNWARKERCILDTLHRTHPPTHEAVAKFQQPVAKNFLQQFQRRFRQNLVYSSKTHCYEFAVYFVREAERNNCVHYHFLIRTTAQFPRKVLLPMIATASDGLAVLQHCEAVNNVAAITRYVVKDIDEAKGGSKTPLLFKPGLRLHLSGSCNGYFVRSKRELWQEWIQTTYGSSVK